MSFLRPLYDAPDADPASGLRGTSLPRIPVTRLSLGRGSWPGVIIPSEERPESRKEAMGSSNLTRWAGLATMVGGVLLALWTVGFNFVGYGDPGTLAYERYEAYNRLLPLVLLPVVVGFPGLHAAQRRGYGWLGKAGLVAALLGLAPVAAGSVGEFWVFTA